MPGNDPAGTGCTGRNQREMEDFDPYCDGPRQQAAYGIAECHSEHHAARQRHLRLVERKVYDSFPPVIEYERTEHARTLEPLIEELRRWGEYHRLVITGTNIEHPANALQD